MKCRSLRLGAASVFRVRHVGLLFAVSLVAGCVGGVGEVDRRCNADRDCGADERCVEGSCEEFDRPVEPEPSPSVGEPEPNAVEPGVVEPDVVEPGVVEPEPAVEPEVTEDAGSTDAGDGGASPSVSPPDGGEPEGGPLDGGGLDAGNSLDAGPLDAGLLDAGALDAGALDGGLSDAGQMDAGPVDAGVDGGPPDAGPVLPTDAFDAPWFDAAYSVRARYRLSNGRGYDYPSFPLAIKVKASELGLAELPGDQNAFRVTTESGEELPFHVERLSSSNAVLWANVTILEGINRQALFVYAQTDGVPTASTASPHYDTNILHAYHFRAVSTGVRDFAGDDDGVSDTESGITGILGRGVSLEGNAVRFPTTSLVETSNPRRGGFSFWIRMSSLPAGEHLVFGDPVAPENAFQIFVAGTRIIVRAFDANGIEIGEAQLTTVRTATWERYSIDYYEDEFTLNNGRFTLDRVPFTGTWDGPVDQEVVFHPSPAFIDEFQVLSSPRGINWSVAAYRNADDTLNLFEDSPLPGLGSEPNDGATTPPSDPILRYRFDETAGDIVHDSSGIVPALDLTRSYGSHQWVDGRLEIERRSIFTTTASTERLRDAIALSGAMSVEVWAQSEHLLQNGPARVFTLSTDVSNRAFTFGQSATSWSLRLRTAESDLNGTSNGLQTNALGIGNAPVSRGLDHVVFVRAQNGEATCFVNGVIVENVDWPGDFLAWAQTDRLAIGNEITDASRTWTGSLSSISLYDRALSASEILDSYAGGSP